MKLICDRRLPPNFCLNPISFKHINARQTELDKSLFEKFDPKEWSIVFLQGNYALRLLNSFLSTNGNNGKSNYWRYWEPGSHLASYLIQSQQAHSNAHTPTHTHSHTLTHTNTHTHTQTGNAKTLIELLFSNAANSDKVWIERPCLSCSIFYVRYILHFYK
jgi:hypothetical protein